MNNQEVGKFVAYLMIWCYWFLAMVYVNRRKWK